MTQRKPRKLTFTEQDWPVQLPQAHFAETVLDLYSARAVAARPIRAVQAARARPIRWSWTAGLVLLGFGVSAAAYELVTHSFARMPLKNDVVAPPIPDYIPEPLGAAISSAIGESNRAAIPARKSLAVAPSAASFTREVQPMAPAPHYPPCHCGPGAVVCSCVE